MSFFARFAMMMLLSTGATAARAADAGAGPDAAWKKEMERKLDMLTQELEKSKLSSGGAPANDGSPAPAIPQAPFSFSPSGGKVYRADRGISFGAYGEMIYQNQSNSNSDNLLGEVGSRTATADMERWVMYLGYRFSDKIVFNSEVEVEHSNSSKSGEVAVEFAYLDFALSEAFGLRVGSLLLPVGLTNEYHEPVVFLGALRPDVETYLIPTTWNENGAGYYGQYGPWAYRGYAVAGMRAAADPGANITGFRPDIGVREGRQEGSQSRAQNLAFVQRLDYTGLPGWIFGGSIYYGKAGQGDTTPTGAQIDAPVTLWETHIRGEYKGVEMRALYTQTTIGGVGEINQANGFANNQSVGQFLWGAYGEIGYNVLNVLASNSAQYLCPFVRVERYNTQAEVPGGYARDAANDRTVYTMGVSYKPIPRVVLKSDYSIRRNHAHQTVGVFALGAGYNF